MAFKKKEKMHSPGSLSQQGGSSSLAGSGGEECGPNGVQESLIYGKLGFNLTNRMGGGGDEQSIY
jgi:hypothetical protein